MFSNVFDPAVDLRQCRNLCSICGQSPGDKYVGSFKDDYKHGQGTLTHPSGTKYVGEWKDDEMHGKGTISTLDGIELKGIFVDGELVGRQ